MEQHPVPQQISSYQFRLVGDMTLKQFFQLAGGALIALLVYGSPLPGIFKWPLVVFFAIAGAALAFLPLEERPLEDWVLAFFRSIYRPTVFYWKKDPPGLKYFMDETTATTPAAAVATATTPTPAVSTDTLATHGSNVFVQLEEQEKNFLSKVTGLFSGSFISPKPVVVEPKAPAPPEKISTPPNQQVYIAPHTQSIPATSISDTQAHEEMSTKEVEETLSGQKSTGPTQAQFSPDAAPPMPPTQANIIVGQVMDPTGHIVEGAILEVRDVEGRPVRALRTNRAGHFLIVTPLASGTYELVIEKPGFIFNPVTLQASGALIPPIAIRASGEEEKSA